MIDLKSKKIGKVNSHFLDSGAFTLWTTAAKYYKENNCGRWDYYDTPEFWEYMDNYARFIKKYKIAIDLYANIDAIGNPEITWRNQKHLEEKHGLTPVPVVHYGSDIKWLKKYVNAGYKIIGFGGLVGSSMKQSCRDWIDECFDYVCDTPDRTPSVKIHGFGVTSFRLLWRYPWWSVDSAAWDKIASFGGICVPHKRKGEFVFNISPYIMKVSMESPGRKTKNHILTLPEKEKIIIQEWLDYIDIPMGSLDEKGEIKEKGIVTYHVYRRISNLYFYDKMVKALPKYPWSFKLRKNSLL